jgi:phosphatidylglycerophosphate synthase
LPESVGLAFKAHEIEELADVYFFRPLGMILARTARQLSLGPIAVTILGAGVGVAGGALLYDERLGLLGFALIVVHSILDSSDGQLARMTGRVTDLGRMLDGVGGYLTHAAIFVAIGASMVAREGGGYVVMLVVGAAASTIVHAQMYDYYRTSYTRAVIDRVVAPQASSRSNAVVRLYEAMQRGLSGRHAAVDASLAERAGGGGLVRDVDRARYRSCFYWPVRGWNLMGDNTRFYAVGMLAWMHRLDWFFGFLLLPMNAAFVMLWLWQARADRRFLARL